ncbi:MAG: hypothetical protein STHCBS139747_006434 [Sporothrix thermara]
MCRGVVNVYSCRHREVGQVYLCHKAYAAQRNAGIWASVVYCFTHIEPRRKCGQTATERRYVGEPCWSCKTGISQPLPRSQNPSSSSSFSSLHNFPQQVPLRSSPQPHPQQQQQPSPSSALHVRPRSHSPPSGGVAPQAYMPEPMMTLGPASSCSFSTPSAATSAKDKGKARAVSPHLTRPQPALLISTNTSSSSSSSRGAPTPQVISIPSVSLHSSSARRAPPPSRPPRSPPLSSTSLNAFEPRRPVRPARPPRPHPSQSPFPLPGSSPPGPRGGSRSSSLASDNNNNNNNNNNNSSSSRSIGVPPLTRPRPTFSSGPPRSLPRFAAATSQSQSRSRSHTSHAASATRRPSPLALQPMTHGHGSASGRPQHTRNLRGSSSMSSPASTRHPARHGIVSRISSALRSPKSTESFACAEARRVERGAQ